MNSKPHLSRKLALETPVETADTAGGINLAWKTIGTLWGELKLASGNESAADGFTLSKTSWNITVRAAPVGSAERPKANQRFRGDGRVFRILSVGEKDQSGRYLLCRAREEEVA